MDTRLRYVPALDGLRALAVGAVVALHAGLGLALGGGVGVDVFFVLSGYLITSLLLGEQERHGRIDLGAFLVRRLRRLAPALVVMIAVVGLFAALAPLELSDQFDYPGLAGSLVIAGSYTANLGIITGVAAGPMFHTWSLGVEMQFYLLWPVFVMRMTARRASPRTLLATIGAAIAAVAVWRVLLLHVGEATHVLYGLDTRADPLLAGAAVAILARAGRLPSTALARLAPVALLILAAVVVLAPSVTQLVYGGYLLIDVCGAILVAHLAAGRLTVLRPLAWRPLVYAGTLSYSIYLWHFPVFHALTASTLGLSRGPSIVVRVALTFILAAASYHLVENRLRASTTKPGRVKALA
ncbi:MAG TPA: acyltransferase [Solirubrobacter sp.]